MSIRWQRWYNYTDLFTFSNQEPRLAMLSACKCCEINLTQTSRQAADRKHDCWHPTQWLSGKPISLDVRSNRYSSTYYISRRLPSALGAQI